MVINLNGGVYMECERSGEVDRCRVLKGVMSSVTNPNVVHATIHPFLSFLVAFALAPSKCVNAALVC